MAQIWYAALTSPHGPVCHVTILPVMYVLLMQSTLPPELYDSPRMVHFQRTGLRAASAACAMHVSADSLALQLADCKQRADDWSSGVI